MALLEIVATSAPAVWMLNPKLLRASSEREPVGLNIEGVAVVASRIIKDMQKF